MRYRFLRDVAVVVSILLCAQFAVAQTTTRVSVSSASFEANARSLGVDITPDGRFIAFYSEATNLTPEATPGIFWRDLLSGTTLFVGPGLRAPAISDDGQVVAFIAGGSQIPSGVPGRLYLFAWHAADRTLDRIADDPLITDATISGNGRYILFGFGHVGASKRVFDRVLRQTREVGAGIVGPLRLTTDGTFAFFTGVSTGITISTPIKVNIHTMEATDVGIGCDDFIEDVSGDGRFILFDVTCVNDEWDLVLKDTETGVVTPINRTSGGQRFDVMRGSNEFGDVQPAISADGRWITFTSSASYIVPGDTNGIDDAFVCDRLTGEFTRVSVPASGGQAQSGASFTGRPTTDGRVLFGSTAHNMVPGDTNFVADLFLRDPNGAPPCAVTLSPSGLALVSNSGGNGSLTITAPSSCAWTATATAPWIRPTNMTSGQGDGTVSYNFDPYFGGTTIRSGAIVVNNAAHGLRQPGEITQPPFGSWDTPAPGATVTGAVPITGWALDDVQVARVRVHRAPVAGEGSALIYVGDAIKVTGARPDVATQNQSTPYSLGAGWGLMVLTNMLPNQGNGEFTFYVFVDDLEGHTTFLGSRRVTAANATAMLPFGTIDTPAQGQTVSGTIINFGWALTPQSGTIPADGSTIDVYIDSVNVGHPAYNHFRSDIATLFPGYANSNGAVGYFVIDTTAYADGLHTIAWVVTDNLGRASGIGSRYFTIQNGPNPVTPPYLRRSHLPMRH